MYVDSSSIPSFFQKSQKKEQPALTEDMPQRIVLFGPPGSGKGTQSMNLVKELHSCHISTGDLLRKEIREQSDLGLKAKDIMSRGELVPDNLVIGILKNKLNTPECKKSAIFDGFPRTINQAQKLDEMLSEQEQKVTHVFNFEVNQNDLIDRISGRRVHEPSGRTYHLKYNPPKVEGKDDVTGEDLIQRKDDASDTVKTRLDQYQKSTLPVLDYYKRSGYLHNLNAGEAIDKVWKNIRNKIFN